MNEQQTIERLTKELQSFKEQAVFELMEVEKERDDALAKCSSLEVENARLSNEVSRLSHKDLPDGIHCQPPDSFFPNIELKGKL